MWGGGGGGGCNPLNPPLSITITVKLTLYFVVLYVLDLNTLENKTKS